MIRNIRNYSQLYIIALAFVISILAYWWFEQSSYFHYATSFLLLHPVLSFFSLVAIKIIGIVWPPLPGGILTLAAVPLLGWQVAYAADLIGSAIGASIAYWIARTWGRQFLSKYLGKKMLAKIEKIKIIPSREVEAVFVSRIFGGTVVEIICYGAGLLRVSFHSFLLGSILSHLAVGIPKFLFVEAVISGKNVILSIILLLLVVPIFWKLKHRYIEM